MSTTPTSLSLTSIADNSQIIASTHRNNNSAVQTAVNAIIAFLSGGTSGQMVQSGGGTTINWANAGGLYKKITTTDIVSSVAETDLLGGGITLGAGVLGATGSLRVTWSGDYLNSTGGNVTLRVKIKLGATTLWDSGAQNFATNAARHPFGGTLLISNRTASEQYAQGQILFGAITPAATTGLGNLGWSNEFGGTFSTSGTVAVDTTASQAVTVNITHGTSSASVSARCLYAVGEVI